MRAVVLLVVALLSGCGLSGPEPEQRETRTPVYYQVKKGDTVASISRRYGVSPTVITRLNELKNPVSLTPGSRLHIGYLPKNRSKAGQGKVVPARYSGQSKSGAVVPAKQANSGKGELLWPVNVGRVVSRFGPRDGSFHDGLDISAPEGTPIYAAHSGTVVYSGDRLGGYGNLVILRHSSGLTTVYAHNSRVFVSTGDRVRRGENIAEVGETGHATGPHLHFEVRTRDRKDRYVAVDPMPLLSGEFDAKPRYRVNEGLTSIMTRLFQ